jgi:hypothetical protein
VAFFGKAGEMSHVRVLEFRFLAFVELRRVFALQ